MKTKKFEGHPGYTVTEKGVVKDSTGEYRPFYTYNFICIYQNREPHYYDLKKLLAEYFLPNPNNYKNVTIIDQDKPITTDNIMWSKYGYSKVGKIYKGLKVTEEFKVKNNRKCKVVCLNCGEESEKFPHKLKNKKKMYCGCKPDIEFLNKKYTKKENNKKYITGLTKDNNLRLKCKDCGKETETSAYYYQKHHNTCRGCYLKEVRN